MQRYNRHSLTITTPPVGLAVSLADMGEYLVLDADNADDMLIEGFILAATDAMESYLRTSLLTQGLRLTKDGFVPFDGDDRLVRLGPGVHTGSLGYVLGNPGQIDLPRGPIQAATITTFDRANNATVFDPSNWFLDTAGWRIVLNEGRVWPDNLRAVAAVQIDYTAGYGDAGDIPRPIIQAIKQHVAQMYECREACDMPKACRQLVDGYRRFDELGWM